ncbi:MAG: hypothetical protein ACT4OV_11110 [Microthrixaceae bacterium]
MSLGLVACGGGSDSASPTTTAAPSDTSDGASAGLVAFKKECVAFLQAFAEAGTAVSSALGGTSNTDLERTADYFDEVTAKVPSDVKADFVLFADAYERFVKAIVDADINLSNPASVDPEKLEQVRTLIQEFSDPKVQKATMNLQEYLGLNCKR